MWCDNCEEDTTMISGDRCSKCRGPYNSPALDHLKEQERLAKQDDKLQVDYDPLNRR